MYSFVLPHTYTDIVEEQRPYIHLECFIIYILFTYLGRDKSMMKTTTHSTETLPDRPTSINLKSLESTWDGFSKRLSS